MQAHVAAMEMVEADPYTFGDSVGTVGTASDHMSMAWAHFQRAVAIALGCHSSKQSQGKAASEPEQQQQQSETGAGPPSGRCAAINPNSSWKEAWDLYVLTFILYSAVMVPFRICFNSPALGNWFWFEQGITVTFIVDVILNFNTAYLEEERWVIDRPSIAKNYLKVSARTAAPSPPPPLDVRCPHRLRSAYAHA